MTFISFAVELQVPDTQINAQGGWKAAGSHRMVLKYARRRAHISLAVQRRILEALPDASWHVAS